MAKFVIQLKLRNPYWFEHTIQRNMPDWMNEAFESVFDKLITHPLLSNLPIDARKDVKEYLSGLYTLTDQTPSDFQKMSLINRFKDTAGDQQVIYDSMLRASWTILRAPEGGPYFITSDNPGFSISANDEISNTKFIDDFAFHFPISPKYCLVISDAICDLSTETKFLPKVDIPAIGVLLINDRTIQVINKMLVASDESYLLQIAELNRPLLTAK